MNKYYCQILVLSLLFSIAASVHAQQISAMSFNIRYDNSNDGENRWSERKESVCETITKYNPDFVGIQEGLQHQVLYIDSVLLNYSYIGVGRDDGDTLGEYSAIYYKNGHFNVLTDSTIWLSETPGKISVGWDASMERICTFGLFQEISTGDRISVFNTHFDHIGEVARLESAKQIIKTIGEICDSEEPLILCGDFNATPKEDPIRLLDNFFSGSHCEQTVIRGSRGTFTGFTPGSVAEKRIDFIFTKNIRIHRYLHLDNKRGNSLFISDHLPVYIDGNRAQKHH